MALFAFSTNAYTRQPLAVAIRQIKSFGYDGVEILADAPHAFPFDLPPDEIFTIARLLDQTGLAVCNINGNTAMGCYPEFNTCGEVSFEPSLCNKDSGIRLKRIEYTKKCIDLAVLWGSRCISLTSGRCLPGNKPEEAYVRLIQSLEEILDHAVKKGINVGIEYEPGLLIENAGEATRLLAELSCPNLGLNLDLGHAKVAGESLSSTIKQFAGKIWNIHLEDIRGRKHYHLVPGEGDMDFKEALDTLSSIGYKGFITLELYTCADNPDDAAKKSLQYLNQFVGG